jgi:glucose uptake protein GlcU
MASPDPEEELRVFKEKEKGRAVLNVFIRILIIDAIVISLYFILANALGWDGTALIIPLVVIAIVTGFYYQWQKQKIDRR